MDEAKIRLSKAERELVTNAGWILTKNGILEKVKQLLGELQLNYQRLVQEHSLLPREAVASRPKISRGENYRGLPWVVLDYPRCFGQPDVLAIRTMFWWGHFFSITLQMAGSYKSKYEGKIILSFPQLAGGGYFICVNKTQWQHHFEIDNYIPVAELGAEQFAGMIKEHPFIKLAAKMPVEQWEMTTSWMPKYFSEMAKILSD
jgi:hypothetical protein